MAAAQRAAATDGPGPISANYTTTTSTTTTTTTSKNGHETDF